MVVTPPHGSRNNVKVAIIGAGIAGISTAIELKRRLHFSNLTIYEQASDIGGTWRDNTYPGCCSDVPGHWYSLSTDLNPDWPNFYITQPEILQYWRNLVAKYDLQPNIVLNASLEMAQWDDDKQVYRLTLSDKVTGKKWDDSANIIVTAIGAFKRPVFPTDVPGRETFSGALFHSAQWRHDIQLSGKRIGVIGNGCSACQFIPAISKDFSVEVINFCRSPSWFTPRQNSAYSGFTKWAFKHLPLVMRAYRFLLSLRFDSRWLGFQKKNHKIRISVRKWMEEYITTKAPKEYKQLLIPKYPPGCKRIIVDDGYLECLGRDNVSLKFDKITEIVPDGIKLATGEVIALDVIILGTGFNVENYGIKVRGRGALLLDEYFDTRGGPEGYLGTTIPTFPNLFTISGPNTAVGHNSIIFGIESQINLAMQLIDPIIDGLISSIEPRMDVCEKHNQRLQEKLNGMVWTDCRSYYQTPSGKNTSLFPGPLYLFWWWTLTPQWEDYVVVGAEKWQAVRNTRWWRVHITLAGFAALALAICISYFPLVHFY